jgi:hypothetical protein
MWAMAPEKNGKLPGPSSRFISGAPAAGSAIIEMKTTAPSQMAALINPINRKKEITSGN